MRTLGMFINGMAPRYGDQQRTMLPGRGLPVAPQCPSRTRVVSHISQALPVRMEGGVRYGAPRATRGAGGGETQSSVESRRALLRRAQP